METELVSKYSSADLTGYYNLTDNTKEVVVGKTAFQWTSEEIARLIQVIVWPILIVSVQLEIF